MSYNFPAQITGIQDISYFIILLMVYNSEASNSEISTELDLLPSLTHFAITHTMCYTIASNICSRPASRNLLGLL